MKKIDVIVLMKILRINPSENLHNNGICIIFWRNMYMVSIKE